MVMKDPLQAHFFFLFNACNPPWKLIREKNSSFLNMCACLSIPKNGVKKGYLYPFWSPQTLKQISKRCHFFVPWSPLCLSFFVTNFSFFRRPRPWPLNVAWPRSGDVLAAVQTMTMGNLSLLGFLGQVNTVVVHDHGLPMVWPIYQRCMEL